LGAEGKGQIRARIGTISFDDANEDGGSMSRFIPYLSEEAIERDAAALLNEYADARGLTIEPPIPIEDILEKHLKLGIEFDDTHKLFGVPRPAAADPDILGAVFFDDRRIVIDETLDPEENPSKEGRYRYTLGHEVADIGGCIATCSPRTQRRPQCSEDPRFRLLFAGRAKPRSARNGRRIFTPRAC
jgi:hypothetical protein